MKIGLKLPSLGKILNISAADPSPPSSFRSIPTLRATKLRYRYTWRMRGIRGDYWPASSGVYVYKRGSNVPLYDITDVAATFMHVDFTKTV